MTRRTRRTRQEEAEEEEEKEEEEKEEEATDIKSNNPHLAGGEQVKIPGKNGGLGNMWRDFLC